MRLIKGTEIKVIGEGHRISFNSPHGKLGVKVVLILMSWIFSKKSWNSVIKVKRLEKREINQQCKVLGDHKLINLHPCMYISFSFLPSTVLYMSSLKASLEGGPSHGHTGFLSS